MMTDLNGDYGEMLGIIVLSLPKSEQEVVRRNDLKESEESFDQMQAISEQLLQDLIIMLYKLQLVIWELTEIGWMMLKLGCQEEENLEKLILVLI